MAETPLPIETTLSPAESLETKIHNSVHSYVSDYVTGKKGSLVTDVLNNKVVEFHLSWTKKVAAALASLAAIGIGVGVYFIEGKDVLKKAGIDEIIEQAMSEKVKGMIEAKYSEVAGKTPVNTLTREELTRNLDQRLGGYVGVAYSGIVNFSAGTDQKVVPFYTAENKNVTLYVSTADTNLALRNDVMRGDDDRYNCALGIYLDGKELPVKGSDNLIKERLMLPLSASFETDRSLSAEEEVLTTMISDTKISGMHKIVFSASPTGNGKPGRQNPCHRSHINYVIIVDGPVTSWQATYRAGRRK